MEQSQQNPNVTPQPNNPETNTPSHEQPSVQPEQQPVVSPEKKPERAPSQERAPRPKDSDGSLVLPQVADQPAADDTQQTTSDDSQQGDFPLIADDVDVIEKEWVDKAKEIIRETKDDPYAQEEAVEKLQADYLKKRYGKDIKISNK